MGLLSFYSYLNSKYEFKKYGINPYHNIIKCDFLHIDMNNVIHVCSLKVIRVLKNQQLLKENNIKEKIFVEIKLYIEEIINITHPTNVFIAVDGLSVLAKINTQRIRKFLHIKKKQHELKIFDRNSIIYGSKFMCELDIYLKEIVKGYNVNVIYYSYLEKHESDYKIINFILKQSLDKKHIIYSTDTDIVFYVIANERYDINVLKESHDRKDCFLYTFNLLRNKIFEDFQSKIKLTLNKNSIIRDWLFICLFLGNDYLPKLYKMEGNKLDFLINIYCKFFDNKYLINDKFEINYQFIIIIFKEIKHYLMENVTNINIKFIEKTDFNEITKEKCKNYVKGLIWNIHYYFNKCIDFEYLYGYPYLPNIDDIIYYLENLKITIDFGKVKNDIINHSVYTIPPQSKYSVDEKYHFIYNKYKEYFPEIIESKLSLPFITNETYLLIKKDIIKH